jgi:hypothetical protein
MLAFILFKIFSTGFISWLFYIIRDNKYVVPALLFLNFVYVLLICYHVYLYGVIAALS